ncbi:MAG: MFS transporter, partial [Pseudomonadota bacterium]
YFPYVFGQIPFGLVSDRYGVRYPLTFSVVACAISVYAFSEVSTIHGAYFFRFFFGFFAAAGFISCLKLANAWLPKAWLGVAVGLTQGMGMLGGLFGTRSMAVFSDDYGWRTTYSCITGAFLVVALLIFLFLKDKPAVSPANTQQKTMPAVSIPEPRQHSLRQPKIWFAFMYCGLLFTAMQVFGESWGANYLEFANHLSKTEASSAISMVFMGWFFGGPTLGGLSGYIGRRPIMQLSAGVSTVLMTILLYVPMSSVLTHMTIFIFGFFSTGLVAAYATVTELSHPRHNGLCLAISNMFTIGLGAALSPLMGTLLDYFWHKHPVWLDNIPLYAAEDYRITFSAVPICLALAFICSLLTPETLKKGK